MADQPVHGGRLNAAAERWQIPREAWLDLSTGINPRAWPVPNIPARVWRRLPEEDDGLEMTIRHWAGVPPGSAVLPVAGSQAAIQALPRLRRPGRVAVPLPGYQEHSYWWNAAGHTVQALDAEAIEAQLDWLDGLDVVVWIQPNNPAGTVLSKARLLDWQRRLARRGGWLIVDEAFIVGSRGESLASAAGAEGLIILRSLGKFFGLAGARAGTVLAWGDLCVALNHALGPWAVSGPARYLMCRALADTDWQQRTEEQLARAAERLQNLLIRYGLRPTGATNLFCYIENPAALEIHRALARQGVLVRHFDQPPALRFGLPGAAREWEKLENALNGLAHHEDG